MTCDALFARWCEIHRDFLWSRNSSLEFNLHRSRYIRILMSSDDPSSALSYARRYFPPLFSTHAAQVSQLTSALAFFPSPRLATSPYADLTRENIHSDLESQFSQEYCALLKMSRQLPLRVVADLGANGALAKIERAKKIMQEKKTEWTAADELPVRQMFPTPVVMALTMNQFLPRSRLASPRKHDIIPSSHVLSPRSKRRKLTRQ